MIRINCKRKGSTGERELVSILQRAGYADAHRSDQRYVGGLHNPDVGGMPGVHLEVKRAERFNVYDALDQATRDADGQAVPVVAHRRNNRSWVVCLWLEDWLRTQPPLV